MLSMIPSIVILGIAAAVALFLARYRRTAPRNTTERFAASRALALATGIQSVHFVEEAVGGFHEEFPALLNLPAMPMSAFVAFNLTWIAIWIASIAGLRSSRPAAFFAAWFLAIAGTLNGIGHPLMAVASGEYFPGLVSAPFIGLASVWLWIQLRKATSPVASVAGM